MSLEKQPTLPGAKLRRVIAVAAAYWVVGQLFMLIAVPPGYVTALWPPAGIALATVFVLGATAVSGVWLAAFLLDLQIGFLLAGFAEAPKVIFASAAIAGGAAAQAWVGAVIMRYLAGRTNSSATPAAAIPAAIAAGPLSCLINPTVSALVLAAADHTVANPSLAPWALWYLGDCIGALLFAPLLLFAWEQPRNWRRLRPVALPVATLVAVSILAFLYVRRHETAEAHERFAVVAEEQVSRLQQYLHEGLIVVDAVAGFFDGSIDITRDEFRNFTAHLRQQHAAIQALAWIPRVTAATRANFETLARRDGLTTFQITDWAGTGAPIPAGTREEYFPIYYIEPFAGNDEALGVDIGTSELRRQALKRARDTGLPIASAPVRLIQAQEDPGGMVVYHAILEHGAVAGNELRHNRRVTGYVAAVFRIRAVVSASLGTAPNRGTVLRIVDRHADPNQSVLYIDPTFDSVATQTAPAGFRLHRTVNAAGRSWDLEILPTPDLLAKTDHPLTTWGILAFGLLLTAFVQGLLLMSSERTAHVERLVTERTAEVVRSNAALREREEIDSAIVNQASDSIALIDLLSGRFVEFNRSAYEHLGYTREEFCKLGLFDIDAGLTPEEALTYLLRLRQAGATTFERRLRRKSGELRDVQINTTLIHVHERDQVVGIWTDITERKRVEQSLLRSQKLEALGTLAGGIAHDFNNILLSICGNAQLALADLRPDDPLHSELTEIAKAGARATALVRRILAFSRPDASGRRPLDLRPTVDEAVKLLRATLPTMIDLRPAFETDVPTVAADPTEIQQIVINLATNAAWAIDSHSGSIDFQLQGVTVSEETGPASPDRPPGRYARLTVRDTGCGMDAATLARVFDPFFTTKAAGQGTGLGLSVVHGIMKSYGGSVTVDSEPGKGTSFSLYFPAIDTPSERPAEPPPVTLRGHGQHVLYVDDDKALVLLVRRSLEKLGYRVTGCTTPEQALQEFRARSSEFHAVVTDLSMPGMSGFDLARALLAVRPDIPVVMTSGYVRTQDEERAAAVGIRHVILKPDTVDELGLVLNQLFHMPPRSDVPDSA